MPRIFNAERSREEQHDRSGHQKNDHERAKPAPPTCEPPGALSLRRHQNSMLPFTRGHTDTKCSLRERAVSLRGDLPVKRPPQNVESLLVEPEDRCQCRELSHAGENEADPIAMAC
jgi:hypothetical protein